MRKLLSAQMAKSFPWHVSKLAKSREIAGHCAFNEVWVTLGFFPLKLGGYHEPAH